MRKLASFTFLSASILLAGCAGNSPFRTPLQRTIGEAPAYLSPEPVPRATAGKNAFIHAAELTQSVQNANVKITCAAAEWAATDAALQQDDNALKAARADAESCVDRGRTAVSALTKQAKKRPVRRKPTPGTV